MDARSVEKFLGPALRLVRVDWKGPFSLANLPQKEGDDYGLYMIEGHNVLFGCKGGLYFGMARDQKYAVRIEQHRWWLEQEQDITIRLGILRREDYENEPPDWPDWYSLIAQVESLTIYWHGFPFNSKHIWGYSGGPLRVQNHGPRGNLLAEYSSDWKPPRPSPDLEE
jgi:hypothetical protein